MNTYRCFDGHRLPLKSLWDNWWFGNPLLNLGAYKDWHATQGDSNYSRAAQVMECLTKIMKDKNLSLNKANSDSIFETVVTDFQSPEKNYLKAEFNRSNVRKAAYSTIGRNLLTKKTK